MYERSYGYRYADLGEHPSVTEIGKAIRRDIRQARNEGLLPSRWTYSVRTRRFAGGCSVDVEVQDCDDAWTQEDLSRCPIDALSRRPMCKPGRHYRPGCDGAVRLTDEAEAARMTLERIHGAYNHDGSEVQFDYFDVRYYGTVCFETAWHREIREADKARKAARALL